MFTGLIQETSKITSLIKAENGLALEMQRPKGFNQLENGESIAVDGACLTLTQFNDERMAFFVGPETLMKTTLGQLLTGSKVNLERSLALGDRLGGHLVSGHVDGTAKVVKKEFVGDCLFFKLVIGADFFRFVIPKGSIALQGVSLTINSISRDDYSIEVLLVPETLARTNLSQFHIGDVINIECDQTVKIIAHQVSLYGVNHEHHA